jgi:hypothetical protein
VFRCPVLSSARDRKAGCLGFGSPLGSHRRRGPWEGREMGR